MLDWYWLGGPPFFGGSGAPPGFGTSASVGVGGSSPSPDTPPPPISPLNPEGAGGAPLIPHDPTIDRRVRRVTDLVSEIVNSLLRRGYIIKLLEHEWRIGPGTYVESRDPTPMDDETRSVMIGDMWLNQATDIMYLCFSATAGVSRWKAIVTS